MANLEFDTIRLSRLKRKNVLTFDIEQGVRIIGQACKGGATRMSVERAPGGAFCAGVDLGVFADESRVPLAGKTLLTDRVRRIAYALEDFDKPVIAAVGGSRSAPE